MEGEKKLQKLDVQSRVIEHQFLSEKQIYPNFEFNNTFFENNNQEIFSQNFIENPKKNVQEKKLMVFILK